MLMANSAVCVHTPILFWVFFSSFSLQSKDWGVKSVRVNSAFHPSRVGTRVGGGGNLRLARGNSRALPRALNLGASNLHQELGPTRGLPSTNWEVHTYMLCMLVAGLALESQCWGVKSVRVTLAFHPSREGTCAGGTLGLPVGNSQALPRALKLGSYCSRPGSYYGGTLVMVVTAVLKAVSQGKHTAATELPSTSSDTSI